MGAVNLSEQLRRSSPKPKKAEDVTKPARTTAKIVKDKNILWISAESTPAGPRRDMLEKAAKKCDELYS